MKFTFAMLGKYAVVINGETVREFIVSDPDEVIDVPEIEPFDDLSKPWSIDRVSDVEGLN